MISLLARCEKTPSGLVVADHFWDNSATCVHAPIYDQSMLLSTFKTMPCYCIIELHTSCARLITLVRPSDNEASGHTVRTKRGLSPESPVRFLSDMLAINGILMDALIHLVKMSLMFS
ncbi:hypothetical protein WA026_003973 [Henosepilachna vigintioctopunctata]|uniref:Uncharacterized protein n=1 Tax=Henosepilachna vigintioctopunctata TaxID=420089 RepID=A0AAW1UEP8_9CUCU